MMEISHFYEEQAHREAYIAMLNSALRQPGSKARFAERVGISRVYLSYLLNPDVTFTPSFRRPNSHLAKAISDAYPGEPEQREALLRHLLLAMDARASASRVGSAALYDIGERLATLRATHGDALHRDDPAAAGRSFRVVRDLSREWLRLLPPLRDPLAYVELCFLLHEVECALNRADEALYAAKRAQITLDVAEAHGWRGSEIDGFRIQAFRAEAVAYHNLRLDREAERSGRAAEASDAWRRGAGIHGLHVYGDRISALSRIPRSSLGDVKDLARLARINFEREAGPLAPLWTLMIRRSLGLAYLQHGNARQAEAILLSALDEADHTPLVGALHRTMLLVAHAQSLREQGSAANANDAMRNALVVASAAGLTHQIGHLRAAFGEMVDRTLEEISGAQS